MVAVISGCGGGGGGGGTGPPAPTPTPKGTPAPTPSPTPNGSRPISSGTFSLTGTYNQSDIYGYPSSPSPSLPPTSTAATVSQAVTVTAGLGQSATISVVEKDAYPLQTTTLTNATSVAQVPNSAGGLNYVEYSSTVTDELNNKIVTTPTVPYILDILPEAAGQTWTNSPAETVNETDADGTTDARTYAADGSYTDLQTFVYGPANITENADGSGVYSSPQFLTNLFYGLGEITFSKPAAGNVTITLQSIPVPTPTPAPTTAPGQPTPTPSPTPVATPAPETLTVAAFYPVPVKLYTETNIDNGAKTIPQACNVPAALGTTGNQIVQTIVRYDTVLGYNDNQTTTSYVVAGLGAVCVQFHDVQFIYYDYQNDTTFNYLFALGARPIQATTIDETVGVQSSSLASASSARSVASASRTSAANAPLSEARIIAGRELFLHAIERQREKRVKALAAAFHSHHVTLKGVAR